MQHAAFHALIDQYNNHRSQPLQFITTPGDDYQIVGDNVDIRVVPRHMTIEHRTLEMHWFHVFAVKHRVRVPPGEYCARVCVCVCSVVYCSVL